jgi:hypothetical protein
LRLFWEENCMRNFVWHRLNFVKIAAISHSWFLKITGAVDHSLGNLTWFVGSFQWTWNFANKLLNFFHYILCMI